MVQTAKIIHQDLFNNENKLKFNFNNDPQKNYVPMSLIMLLQIISEGTNILLFDDNKTDIAVGLSRLIKFNNIKWKSEQNVLHVQHKNFQETPLTMYTYIPCIYTYHVYIYINLGRIINQISIYWIWMRKLRKYFCHDLWFHFGVRVK